MAQAKLPEFLKSLFWDVDHRNISPQDRAEYVIKRILEYGDRKTVHWMRRNFKKIKIKEVLCRARDLSPQSANYWAIILGVNRKRIKCLQKRYLEIRKSCWPY